MGKMPSFPGNRRRLLLLLALPWAVGPLPLPDGGGGVSASEAGGWLRGRACADRWKGSRQGVGPSAMSLAGPWEGQGSARHSLAPLCPSDTVTNSS